MVAYELRRLWQDVNVTIEEGIEEPSSLCATEAIIGNVLIQKAPEPRESGKLLLKKASVILPDAIFYRNVNVFARKKRVEDRRNSLKTHS